MANYFIWFLLYVLFGQVVYVIVSCYRDFILTISFIRVPGSLCGLFRVGTI